jgi:hypothetical protein
LPVRAGAVKKKGLFGHVDTREFAHQGTFGRSHINAQISGNVGVRGDQSGIIADVGGPGSVIAAREKELEARKSQES